MRKREKLTTYKYLGWAEKAIIKKSSNLIFGNVVHQIDSSKQVNSAIILNVLRMESVASLFQIP